MYAHFCKNSLKNRNFLHNVHLLRRALRRKSRPARQSRLHSFRAKRQATPRSPAESAAAAQARNRARDFPPPHSAAKAAHVSARNQRHFRSSAARRAASPAHFGKKSPQNATFCITPRGKAAFHSFRTKRQGHPAQSGGIPQRRANPPRSRSHRSQSGKPRSFLQKMPKKRNFLLAHAAFFSALIR